MAIVWLASYPKSGNTWIRMFLRNYILDTSRPADLNQLAPFEGIDSDRSAFEQAAGGAIGDIQPGKDLAKLRPRAHRILARRTPGIFYAKSHAMLGVHEGSMTVSMDVTAGAIYIVRNPLDVCLSFASHYDLSIDDTIAVMADQGRWLEGNARHVPVMMSSWSMNVESWTHQDQATKLVLRYEDLQKNPRKQFLKVLKHLNIDRGDNARFKRALKFSSFSSLQQQEKDTGFMEGRSDQSLFFRQGRVEQWKDVLSASQIDRLCNDHGGMMQKFGYLPS